MIWSPLESAFLGLNDVGEKHGLVFSLAHGLLRQEKR
jgi:hypothetical protein